MFGSGRAKNGIEKLWQGDDLQRNGKVETGGAEISNGYELNCYVRQWNSDDLIGNGKAPSSMVMLRNGKVTQNIV